MTKEMKTLKQYKDEQMKDSAFAKEYEEIQAEMEAVSAIVETEALQNTAVEEKETKEETQDKNWWKFIKENIAAIITVVTAILTAVYAALRFCMFVYWKGYFARMCIDVAMMNLNFDKSIFMVIFTAIIIIAVCFFESWVYDIVEWLIKKEKKAYKGIKKILSHSWSFLIGLFLSLCVLSMPNIPLVILLSSMAGVDCTLSVGAYLFLLLYIMEMLFVFMQLITTKERKGKKVSKETRFAIKIIVGFIYALVILVGAFYSGNQAINKKTRVQLAENEEYMISYCDGEHYVLHKVKYENEEIIIYINEQKIVGIEDYGYNVKKVKNVIIEE